MSCENYRELLVSHLCGEIEREAEADLQLHLENCEGCKQTFSEYSVILGLIKQWPEKEWQERLRIKDMLRRQQRWRAIVFSKAAIWVIALTALIATVSFMPLRWELNPQQFSLSWGTKSTPDADLAAELKNVQTQLVRMQTQDHDWHNDLEMRIKLIMEQNNVEQQKRYWQTLELFGNYMQLQRKADLQKIQHEIASNYDRTGHEVERTNQLLEYVLHTSAPDGSVYEVNK